MQQVLMTSGGWIPLIAAVFEGYEGCARLLLKHIPEQQVCVEDFTFLLEIRELQRQFITGADT